jgi:ferredoxin
MIIKFFSNMNETKYIRLSKRKCQGCWECVAVCPEDVLVKIHHPMRPHVHIKDAQACSGCKKCVRACEHAAIEYTYVPKPVQMRRQPAPIEK